MSDRAAHDVLVIGAGIAGMEAALTLGDMGHRVLLVEKEPSVGGKMILLSKVFPTLDCASCISTPKMAATAHHDRVEVAVNAEVEDLERRADGTFRARLRRRPTFVDPAACTGCGECERRCTVAVPDRFNFDLVASRAIAIAFPQAVPKKAVIERAGTSPCSAACPAGVKAHGFVSLVRAGKHEEAFRLHMEDAPLVGSLSRACYAPCQESCTRGDHEGSVSIRGVKRFLVDRHREAERSWTPAVAPPTGKRVAVVGSGPAGLSAAWFLARRGHEATVLEAAGEPGGLLRSGIPPFRLPREVLDRDIEDIAAVGVRIRTGVRVRSARALLADGFDAVFLAVGTLEPQPLDVPGRALGNVLDALPFLASANRGQVRLDGRRVAVIGGGNVAVDAARMALRAGAAEVSIHYRRTRAEMPAHDFEVAAALEEGIALRQLTSPERFLGRGGELAAVEWRAMRLGEPDQSGRRRPEPIPGRAEPRPADVAILAIGLRPGTGPFAEELARNGDGTLRVDPETLATSVPGVFAGGDAVTGSSMIVQAVAQGKRAAFAIDRRLRGETGPAGFDRRLPAVTREAVRARSEAPPSPRPPAAPRELPPAARARSTAEIESTMSEAEARFSAARCLDCGVCSECGECVSACPAGAIRLDQPPREEAIEARAVVVATGFRLFDPRRKPAYSFGRAANVIIAMQMDRVLAPTRPYNAVVRPSDGKAPSNVAFVLCTGSRDCTVDNRLCSRVCCMYSIKQAQLLMGALPLADVTLYFIDVRAFGKGYQAFAEQARGMGVRFVKGRVGRIEETGAGDLVVHFEDIAGGGAPRRAEHDLVVLSVGLSASPTAFAPFRSPRLEADAFGYVREPDEVLEPGRTSVEGVFVAGTASAIRDIPDTILHAGAAAVQAAGYLRRRAAARGSHP